MFEIEVKKLTHFFDYTQVLFKNFSFSFQKGALTLVVGPNGSGKSTLLKLVAKLILPFSGEIIHSSKAFHFVGQENTLKPELTLAENIVFWLKLNARGENLQLAKWDSLFEQLGLKHFKHQRVKRLSLGIQQRARLLPLWCLKRSVWILDEPLTHLEQAARCDFLKLLKIHLNRGGSAIIATHLPQAYPNGSLLELSQAS